MSLACARDTLGMNPSICAGQRPTLLRASSNERVLVWSTLGWEPDREKVADPHKTAALPKMIYGHVRLSIWPLDPLERLSTVALAKVDGTWNACPPTRPPKPWRRWMEPETWNWGG